jgi:hypothetical protein
MNITKISATFLLFASVSLLSPEPAWAAWTGWTKVVRIYAGYDGGPVIITLANDSVGPACQSNAYRHDTDSQKFLSLMLTALAADREVSINVGSSCNGDHRIALQAQIH